VLKCDCIKCQMNKGLKARLKTIYDDFGKDEYGRWREFIDNTQYMICPPRVRGYALNKKIWAQLKVDNLEVIEEKKNPVPFNEKLVLREDDNRDYKAMIRSLVEHHVKQGFKKEEGIPGQLQDFVPNKGEGLVILLHGKC